MSAQGTVQQDAQPAFVLHSYPFHETSLIVEAFTRDHGRVALVARGARRPRSALRGMLLAFQPLLLSLERAAASCARSSGRNGRAATRRCGARR